MPKKSKKKSRKPKIKRDWSHLPPELLQVIAGYLIDVLDYIRFRAVCIPWRSALTSSTLNQQLPWLLLSSDNPTASSCRLFSLSSSEIFTFPLPEIRGKRIFGSSNGLLLFSHASQSVSLFNPHTKSITQLPPLTQKKHKELYKGSFISLSSSSYVVIVAFRVSSTLVFCRSGDNAWTKIYASRFSTVVDFTYHMNKFFILESTGRFTIVDDTTFDRMSMNEPSSLAVCKNSSHRYLVNLASGKLVLVIKEGRSFRVYRMDLDGEWLSWTRVRYIGNNMLFVDDHHAMSLDPRKFPGFRRNCIYFVEPSENFYCVYSFHLNGKAWKHSCCWSKFPEEWTEVAWFVPSITTVS